MEIQKVEWKRTKIFFLDEIKSIGHNYLGAVIWQKKWKIVGTNFNPNQSTHHHPKVKWLFWWRHQKYFLWNVKYFYETLSIGKVIKVLSKTSGRKCD